MTAHQTPADARVDDRPTQHAGDDAGAFIPEFDGNVALGLEPSVQHGSTAMSTRLRPTDSAQRSRKPRSTAGVVVTRLLAGLVVALVIVSVVGLTVFDRRDGNSAAAAVSVAMGGYAAVLGLITGFIKAYRSG